MSDSQQVYYSIDTEAGSRQFIKTMRDICGFDVYEYIEQEKAKFEQPAKTAVEEMSQKVEEHFSRMIAMAFGIDPRWL